MQNFCLFTDSACDIDVSLLKEWNVESINMTYRFETDNKDYFSGDMPIKDFYNMMREGAIAKTAAINPQTFIEAFKPILKEGKDILYLAFSSGLSTTYNSANIAAEELSELYPERKVLVVDTLCASAGQGLLVYLTAQKAKEGFSLEDAAKYAESIKLNLCHIFTVDDLVYLKRGGRVSSAVALMGKALGIKPILHVDNEGHLVSLSKVRGRKASLMALAERYKETALEQNAGTIFISNGDCAQDAEFLADAIKENCKVEVKLITDIGAVIGAHSGPGTMALFYLGKER